MEARAFCEGGHGTLHRDYYIVGRTGRTGDLIQDRSPSDSIDEAMNQPPQSCTRCLAGHLHLHQGAKARTVPSPKFTWKLMHGPRQRTVVSTGTPLYFRSRHGF